MLSFIIFIKAAKSCTWIFTQSLADHSENHKWPLFIFSPPYLFLHPLLANLACDWLAQITNHQPKSNQTNGR